MCHTEERENCSTVAVEAIARGKKSHSELKASVTLDEKQEYERSIWSLVRSKPLTAIGKGLRGPRRPQTPHICKHTRGTGIMETSEN